MLRPQYGDFLNAEGAKVSQRAQKKTKKQPSLVLYFS
jgi:hypothetical protein